jgi:hypothetical protein
LFQRLVVVAVGAVGQVLLSFYRDTVHATKDPVAHRVFEQAVIGQEIATLSDFNAHVEYIHDGTRVIDHHDSGSGEVQIMPAQNNSAAVEYPQADECENPEEVIKYEQGARLQNR